MSDKYQVGSVSPDVPLKDTVGQFYNCIHCMSDNIFCKGLEAFSQYMIISGECKDCGKKTAFAITRANDGELDIFGDDQ